MRPAPARLSLAIVPIAGLLLVAGCTRAPAADAGTDAAAPSPAAATAADADVLARGEYLVRVGQCNDCHTPGYAEQQGQLPTAQWLTGNAHAFAGPWGTTFPSNLRRTVHEHDEAGWLAYTATLHTRPPMPDYALRAMSEADRRALYRFIHSLGPAGDAAPAYLPPGQLPPPPYMQLVLPAAPAAGQG